MLTANELFDKVLEHMRDKNHRFKYVDVGRRLGMQPMRFLTVRSRCRLGQGNQTKNILIEICDFCVDEGLDLQSFLYIKDLK